MRNAVAQKVRELASNIPAGETGRYRCPSCFGGADHERSFVLTAFTHHVVYHCFRAKCGFTGALSTSANTNPPSKAMRVPRPYRGALEPIPAEMHQAMFAKYELSELDIAEQGISYAKEINRVRFPMYDYRGYVFGENLRAVTSEQKPKALINKFNDVPNLHFPLNSFTDTGKQSSFHSMSTPDALVLVEDQVSAIKVSKVQYCAALMGTNLSDQGIKQLMTLGIKKVILMLDGDDAGLKASMKLQRELSAHFIVKPVLLEKGNDPKHKSLEELNKRITACLTN